ncbi:WhiB family transcriptional regulator [Kitasatospora sp. NPDC096204]|uniref:WhiB family transcriptional regulator n=1 Tax=Kitasatospora sp. NPDC096204 TaxID=3364094 RepID=UPI0037FD5BEC
MAAQLHSLLAGATRTPHLVARPAATVLAEYRPDGDGDLRGAACAGVDTNLFFPEVDEDAEDIEMARAAAEWSERRAKMFCAGCPVRTMCLELALERREKYGIFGGLNAAERAALHRRRQDYAARERRAAGGAH